MGRKLRTGDGAAMKGLCAEMSLSAEFLSETPALAPVGRRLAAGIAALEQATDWMLANGGASSLAGATPYLKLAGDVIGGWMLGRQALAAAGSDDPWMQSKAALARVFAAQVLADWLRECRFYLYSGLVSIQGGNIPDARRRFGQMLNPHGIAVPPFREERGLAERYLRMMDAAAKPEH